MAAKITSFIVTLLLTVTVGVVILFFMLLAMNGYGESVATWGLGVYVLLALVVAVSVSVCSWSLVGFLTKTKYGAVVSSLIAVGGSSLVGIALQLVSSLIGIGVAEVVRRNF